MPRTAAAFFRSGRWSRRSPGRRWRTTPRGGQGPVEQCRGHRCRDIPGPVARHTVPEENQRFGGTIEHQADAHASREHHRDPGRRPELRFLIGGTESDGAETTQRHHQDKDHEDRAEQHEGPTEFTDHRVQAGGGEGGEGFRGQLSPASDWSTTSPSSCSSPSAITSGSESMVASVSVAV